MSVFNETQRKPSLLALAGVAIVCIGFVAFMIPFLVTGDLRWFLPGVSDPPQELLIWQQGESISIKPGDPDYETLRAEVDWALTHIVQYSDFGPSVDTLEATRNGLSLEVLFGKDITIHSQWNMGKPSRLLFPLSGYYYPERRFFLGQEERYRAGGPQVEDITRMHDAVVGVLTSRNSLLPTPTPELLVFDTPTPLPPPTETGAPEATDTPAEPGAATSTPLPGSPGTETPIPTPTTLPAANLQDGGLAPEETLARLNSVVVPPRDLYLLNQQLRVKSAEPPATVVRETPREYNVGDSDSFWVGDLANNSYYTITAVLIEKTEHGYWWMQDDYDADREAIRSNAQAFESDIYPTTRASFGAEPGPGIENDPRITVLYAPIPGVGGYFSSADAYPQSINQYSNERKMIYIASDPAAGASLGTLAHEFQHMIHFARHMQQDVWINEGMSELAMKLNGYEPGGVEFLFQNDTDVQLNHWSGTPGESLPHYGAAYMFMDYFYQQYGGPAGIEAILDAPGNNINAVDQALQSLGRQESFANVFANWTLANLLDLEELGGRYEYLEGDVQVQPSKSFSSLPGRYTGTVHQQAADYVEVTPRRQAGDIKVDFSGEPLVQVLSARPHSGEGMWWSNRGDLSNTTLTREFDLTGATDDLTLSFWLWYDIEADYDFGYIEASTDGGATWDTLPGRFTTEENSVGTNFGHGFSGSSGGSTPAWVQEEVDLSAYAGQRIMLRFEYITDDGYNSQGLAIDDIRIDGIGYSDDVESGSGGWQANGFARIGAAIPQEYAVAVVTYPDDNSPRVNLLLLDDENKGSLTVDALGSRIDRVVVVVGALAPYTIQRANYTVSIEEAP